MKGRPVGPHFCQATPGPRPPCSTKTFCSMRAASGSLGHEWHGLAHGAPSRGLAPSRGPKFAHATQLHVGTEGEPERCLMKRVPLRLNRRSERHCFQVQDIPAQGFRCSRGTIRRRTGRIQKSFAPLPRLVLQNLKQQAAAHAFLTIHSLSNGAVCATE